MPGTSKKSCLQGTQKRHVGRVPGIWISGPKCFGHDTVALLPSVPLSYLKPVLKRDKRVGCQHRNTIKLDESPNVYFGHLIYDTSEWFPKRNASFND